MTEHIIKTYQGNDVGVSQCLVTLEGFIGDMENAELADDSTVDASDAVTAINGLIWSLEQREAEVGRLRTQISDDNRLISQGHDLLNECEQLRARNAELLAALREIERLGGAYDKQAAWMIACAAIAKADQPRAERDAPSK